MRVDNLRERFLQALEDMDWLSDRGVINLLTFDISIRELVENNVRESRIQAYTNQYAKDELEQCDECAEYYDDIDDLNIEGICKNCEEAREKERPPSDYEIDNAISEGQGTTPTPLNLTKPKEVNKG